MSLDNYKNDLKSYTDSEVTTQLNQAKDNLENAFSKYADKLNSGALTSIKANTTMIGTVSKHVNDIVGQWSSKNYSNSDLNMWMKDSKNNVLSLLPDGAMVSMDMLIP